VVIAIAAHRYGWVPNDSGQAEAKSITWLECEHAWNVTKKEVLGFVVDAEAKWPLDQYENYRPITERSDANIAKSGHPFSGLSHFANGANCVAGRTGRIKSLD
jgi:hypothetical protein